MDNQSENKNKTTLKKIGTRLEVFHGKAKQTGGGLKKEDLMLNKGGAIVSVKASNAAKKNDNLVKAGYVCEKGKFGVNYIGGANKPAKKSAKKSPKKSPRKSPKEPEPISFF